MVAQYADWVTEGDVKDADKLKPGEGGIISSAMKRLPLIAMNKITCIPALQFVRTLVPFCNGMRKKNLLIARHMVHAL